MTWEWLIAVPVYIHVACTGLPGWEGLLERAFSGASARYADAYTPGDYACPVEIRPQSIEVWREGDDGWLAPSYGRSPTPRAGVVVQCGNYGPSFYGGRGRVVLNVGSAWDRYGDKGEWALAHEWGHVAGLRHSDSGCSLMWYGSCSGCGPRPPPEECPNTSRRLRVEQCVALQATAQPWRPPAPRWR